MKKCVDLDKTIFELCEEYPELVDIFYNVGFKEIKNKTAYNSVGRVMTINNGSKIKNIPTKKIIAALEENGFEVAKEGTAERAELLKTYVQRLNDGEDLEEVRKDFVKNFRDVDASEIMSAEQDLMREGTPLKDVQKLCDVHSALFHGATREEKIANAEKEVAEQLKKRNSSNPAWKVDYSDKKEAAARLRDIEGHPINIMTLENNEFLDTAKKLRENLESGEDITELFEKARKITIHYAKKGDLIYPLLKVKYEISGPSDVMWTVDDEIRDEINRLGREKNHDEKWKERLVAVLTRAEEMAYKEANILFPICAKNFSDDEWISIYADFAGYDPVISGKYPIFKAADEKKIEYKPKSAEGEIVFPTGHMTLAQLTALLNTIPMEISFIDENNMNRYFNEGWKLFKRPNMAIDREVFSCHPPKVEPMVRAIIEDLRAGHKDSVPVWMEKQGQPMLVNYMAVRDSNKKYLGTVELVTNMSFAKDHFEKK